MAKKVLRSAEILRSSQNRSPLSPLPLYPSAKHYPPGKILSELFPAILDRIITGNYSKRINLIVIRPIAENTLPFTDPMTLGWEFSMNKILQ